MKPLAAHACARPLTAPSTMTLLEQPNRARCAINCRIHCSLMERARSRSSAGYCPATLPLDSLVGSLAACPIASIGPAKAAIAALTAGSVGTVSFPGAVCSARAVPRSSGETQVV